MQFRLWDLEEGATKTQLSELEPARHVYGAERVTLGEALLKEYVDGASIRDLAAIINRSYGFVRRLLGEMDAPFRSRGGARWKRRRA